MPPCTGDLCTPLYHSQDQAPPPPDCGPGNNCDCGGVPCGEYLFDHRNKSLREWIVKEHILGPLGMGNPNVSGFYFGKHTNHILPTNAMHSLFGLVHSIFRVSIASKAESRWPRLLRHCW